MAKDKGKHAWYTRWYVGLAAAVVLILGVVLLLFTGTPVDRLRTFHIPAGSMIPTVLIDDYVAVLMPAEREAAIRPCDVAVFKKPGSEPEVDYIKRIVAVAGDHVAYVGGRLRLNGQIVPREKIRVEGSATIFRETLPNGCSYLIQELDDRVRSTMSKRSSSPGSLLWVGRQSGRFPGQPAPRSSARFPMRTTGPALSLSIGRKTGIASARCSEALGRPPLSAAEIPSRSRPPPPA